MDVRQAMARAASLAEAGRFRVEPNPVVGCVVLQRGRVVGEGHHAAWGGPHAEVAALRAAGTQSRGATVCVTLEPCAHRGKTPPCTKALVRAKVRRVVYAHPDPNPATAGAGPRVLREAGIRVERLAPSSAIRKQLGPYLAHRGRARPWVIAKWAMTLDGALATRTGSSRWVSGPAARNWAHRHLRARVDAILVGARTVYVDDPELTNRSRLRGQPLRVVVAGRRALRKEARVFDAAAPTLVLAPKGTRVPRGVEILRCGAGAKVSPKAALRALQERGIERLLLEGGGALEGSFLDAGLIDQVCVFVAPLLAGGQQATRPSTGRGVAQMSDAFGLEHARSEVLGQDLLVEGLVRQAVPEQAAPNRRSPGVSRS